MKSPTLTRKSDPAQTIKLVAWILTILLSWLPNIFFYELMGNLPPWLRWAKIELVFGFIGLSFVWEEIRVLRKYALAFGALWLSLIFHSWIFRTSSFQNFLNTAITPASRDLIKELLELISPGIMILTLILLLGNRKKFFLAKGDASVATEPIPLLGIRAGTSVRTLVIASGLILSAGTVLWLLLERRPDLSMFITVLPLLPTILLSNLLSTFGEEVMFRASLISVSHEIVGKRQSLWMVAFVFGSAHYIGGQINLLPGFLITGIAGYGLGKIMLESRSILLPWFLHFTVNSIIFIFDAMG